LFFFNSKVNSNAVGFKKINFETDDKIYNI